MTTLIIRFAYLCLILTLWSLVMAVIYSPYWLFLSTPMAYIAGWLHRESMIIITKKWYNGKELL